MTIIQKTKSIKGSSLEDLSEKLNAFYKVKNVFATQVFLRGDNEHWDKEWYEALVYYKEEDKA